METYHHLRVHVTPIQETDLNSECVLKEVLNRVQSKVTLVNPSIYPGNKDKKFKLRLSFKSKHEKKKLLKKLASYLASQ